MTKLLLRICVTLLLVGTIAWQLRSQGIAETIGALGALAPGYVAATLLLQSMDRALMTRKWLELLSSRGVRLGFLSGMKIYCASMMWGMLLPATVGADAVRGMKAVRQGLDAREVFSSIVVERMVGFLVALTLGLLAVTFLLAQGTLDQLAVLWWASFLSLALVTGAFAMSLSHRGYSLLHETLLFKFRNNRIAERFKRFHETYRGYGGNKGVLARFGALSVVEQTLTLATSWTVALALGIEVSFLTVMSAAAVALLVSRVPVSLSGIGVFDGVFILLMSLAGVSPAQSVALVVLGRVLEIVSWVPWWAADSLESKRSGRVEHAVKQRG